ncbi:MAG: D-glycero-beta-D-manno-heptose-7-phosphate kinase [Alphaproteobacteria bacterium]|nr:D-glycero-beta-D-manno-heptose-7-phosphate kinase [Alphaproteobacteria bacterium]MCW5740887.1 D-glycero-beta-D-manno-heptose-7-phosphate kinase [Alphaproteobacteria bacterium]
MIDTDALFARLPALGSVRVLVVGDVMLDRYIYGTVERISPEAPIPVLRIERESAMLGGAGNVARNLAALGAQAIFATAAGGDTAGREIAGLMGEERAIEAQLVIESGRVSTVKNRFIGGAQQLLRADRELAAPLSATARQNLLARVAPSLAECDVVILSDYGKGVLAEGVARDIIGAARAAGRPVIVDPKGRDYGVYAGATSLTPNRHELADATGMPAGSDAEIEAASRALIARLGLEHVLATRGAQGLSLVRAGGAALHVPARSVEVFDVSGAGDTVIATFAAALGGGLTGEDAASLANVAAALVVAKLGTATCSLAELARGLLGGGGTDPHASKIADLARLRDEVARWRQAGLKVGFTNGCFDLLHPGHVSLMRQARAACDRLVVGLNSDDSVRRLKGAGRPVNGETARATVLASLADVDLVTVFTEDTPLGLIEAIRPDVLVKGADYTRETVVGADLVESWGGRIVLAALAEGHSTTATIRRLGGA